MQTQRQAKIKELQVNIELASKEYQDKLRQYRDLVTDPDKKEELKTLSEEMTKDMLVLEAMGEELDKTKRNKLSSSFFEWLPSPPNRRARRAANRMRRI